VLDNERLKTFNTLDANTNPIVFLVFVERSEQSVLFLE